MGSRRGGSVMSEREMEDMLDDVFRKVFGDLW